MQWRQETVDGHGARLFVRRVVDPPAPPVLLLHGLGVGGSIWQSFARRLLPHLAAVAPDLRGHGQSDAPDSGYAPTDYANDLLELIEAELQPRRQAQGQGQGRTPVPIVGHSLGALVAMAMAELRPDLVSWLVLLDPPLDPDLPNAEVPASIVCATRRRASSRPTCSAAIRAAGRCSPRAWPSSSGRLATRPSRPCSIQPAKPAEPNPPSASCTDQKSRARHPGRSHARRRPRRHRRNQVRTESAQRQVAQDQQRDARRARQPSGRG